MKAMPTSLLWLVGAWLRSMTFGVKNLKEKTKLTFQMMFEHAKPTSAGGMEDGARSVDMEGAT